MRILPQRLKPPMMTSSCPLLLSKPTSSLILTFILMASQGPVAAADPYQLLQQRDVLNPVDDNPFLHLRPEESHRLIIVLVYVSVCE